MRSRGRPRERQPRDQREGVIKYQRSVGLASVTARGRSRRHEHPVSNRIRHESVHRRAHDAARRGASITLDSKLAEFYTARRTTRHHVSRPAPHRSGLSNYTEAAGFRGVAHAPKPPPSSLKAHRRQRRALRTARTLDTTTRTTGCRLHSEKIHDKPYGDIVRQRIRTRFTHAHRVRRGEGGMPISYEKNAQGWKAIASTEAALHGGAGSLTSTRRPTWSGSSTRCSQKGGQPAASRRCAINAPAPAWVSGIHRRRQDGPANGGAIGRFAPCVSTFRSKRSPSRTRRTRRSWRWRTIVRDVGPRARVDGESANRRPIFPWRSPNRRRSLRGHLALRGRRRSVHLSPVPGRPIRRSSSGS